MFEAELFDSNILIDALRGHPEAANTLKQSSKRAISVITWMEVLAGEVNGEDQAARAFLEKFLILGLSDEVQEVGMQLRRGLKLKLMDAIILATARVSGRVLVSRNTKDFPEGTPGVRVPYQL